VKIRIIPEPIKRGYLALLNPIVDLSLKLELNPNIFTTLGFLIAVGSAYCFAVGRLFWGGVLLLLSGTVDVIDGRVARASKRVTKFGALYDSTLDRYGEVVVFFGLEYYFVKLGWIIPAIAVLVSLAGSMMVSYVRARAEGLGLSCKVGILQRPERIVLVGFSSLAHVYALVVILVIVAILANVTAIQRLYHIWAIENGRKKANNLQEYPGLQQER